MTTIEQAREVVAAAHAALKSAKNPISYEVLEGRLKAAHAALKAAKAAATAATEPEPAFSKVDARSITERQAFREWKSKAKVEVWFIEHNQYPSYSADAYYASREECEAAGVPADYIVRMVRVPANCATSHEVFSNEVLFELYKKTTNTKI